MKHHGLRFGAHNLGGVRPKNPPRKHDPENLTRTQRRALNLASRKGGTEPASIGKPTRTNLAERELITISEDVVLITKKGRKLLAQPLPDRRAIHLKKRDGLTTMVSKAVLEEGEIIDRDTIKGYWFHEAEGHRLDAQERKAAARHIRDQAKAA